MKIACQEINLNKGGETMLQDVVSEMWARELRLAWRQAHIKRGFKGHCTKQVPWTWQEFREWFRSHLEKGVALGLGGILSYGDWDNLRKGCLRGMMLPEKAPF